jgi:hypothetical protein
MKDAQSGRMVDDYWEASKKMLMEDDFLNSLRAYDKDNIDPSIIKKIKVRAGRCSRACRLQSQFLYMLMHRLLTYSD